MPPRKPLGDVLLRLQTLHQLDDLEVGHARDLRVLREVEVLLGEEDALCGGRTGGGVSGGGVEDRREREEER